MNSFGVVIFICCLETSTPLKATQRAAVVLVGRIDNSDVARNVTGYAARGYFGEHLFDRHVGGRRGDDWAERGRGRTVGGCT